MGEDADGVVLVLGDVFDPGSLFRWDPKGRILHFSCGGASSPCPKALILREGLSCAISKRPIHCN